MRSSIICREIERDESERRAASMEIRAINILHRLQWNDAVRDERYACYPGWTFNHCLATERIVAKSNISRSNMDTQIFDAIGEWTRLETALYGMKANHEAPRLSSTALLAKSVEILSLRVTVP